MRIRTFAIRLLWIGAAFTASTGALAQRTMYRCSSEGRAYLSDRPCEDRSAIAPTTPGPTRDARSAYPSAGDRTPGKAAAYLDYLSPLCADLNEGLRTGPSRGLRPQAINELSNSYRERCGEEDQVARRRLADVEGQKRESRRRDLAAETLERDQLKLTREQCEEMYRIVHGKRQRLATMTPGERSDFDRFEATWQARCKPS